MFTIVPLSIKMMPRHVPYFRQATSNFNLAPAPVINIDINAPPTGFSRSSKTDLSRGGPSKSAEIPTRFPQMTTAKTSSPIALPSWWSRGQSRVGERLEVRAIKYDAEDDDDPEDESLQVARKREQEEQRRVNRCELFMTQVLELDRDNLRDRATMLAFRSVSTKTLCSHISHYNNLFAFARENEIKGAYPISNEVFEYFIADPKFSMMNTSLDAMKSAVNFFLRCTGQRGEAARTDAVAKGRQMTNNPGMKGQRGAITKDMVDQMLKHEKIPQLYKDCFVILSASGMRRSQLETLRLSRCRFDENASPPCWVMTADRNFKGKKGRMGGQAATEDHECNPAWNSELAKIFNRVKERKSANNPDPIVSHGFKPELALQFIQLAAEKWGDLEWVIHSLRHGAAADALLDYGEASVVEGFKAAQKRTNHVTFSMLAHYTMNNVDRQYIVRSQQAAIMARNTSLQNRTRLFQQRLADEKVRRHKHGNIIDKAVQRRARKSFQLQQQQASTKSDRQKVKAESALKESVAAAKKKAKKATVVQNAVKKKAVRKAAIKAAIRKRRTCAR